MDATEIIIKNWPKTNFFTIYIPIGIALLALIMSTRSFRMSHRPYVWGGSYVVEDTVNKTLIPIPFRVLYRVTNSPAKIIKGEVQISLNEKTLFIHTIKDRVRFPDGKSEWNFGMSEENFGKIMNRSKEEQSKLIRLISLDYSSLGGGKSYYYILEQSFDPNAKQWYDSREEAN